MNDAAAPDALASTPNDLLENLRELGQALPVSFQPTSHDSAPLLAGVIYYLATGSLIAPRVDVPNQAEINADLAEQTRLNEADAKIAELERQLAAQSAAPAAVAPAPTAPVEPGAVAPLDPPAPAAPDAPPTEAQLIAAWQAQQAAGSGAVGS